MRVVQAVRPHGADCSGGRLCLNLYSDIVSIVDGVFSECAVDFDFFESFDEVSDSHVVVAYNRHAAVVA